MMIKNVTHKETARDGRRKSRILSGIDAYDLALQLGGAGIEDDKELSSQLLKLFQGHRLVHIPEPILSFI
jgi:hypothetical protein